MHQALQRHPRARAAAGREPPRRPPAAGTTTPVFLGRDSEQAFLEAAYGATRKTTTMTSAAVVFKIASGFVSRYSPVSGRMGDPTCLVRPIVDAEARLIADPSWFGNNSSPPSSEWGSRREIHVHLPRRAPRRRGDLWDAF